MDAMGLAFKKPHTVSTSLSGSFNHDPAEGTKFPGIVSTVPLLLAWSEAILASSASPLLELLPSPPSLACCTNFSQRRAVGWSVYASALTEFATVAQCLPP